MLDLFYSFWWLAFPLSAFVLGAWRTWLAHKARHDTLDLIQTYVRSGRDVPPELLARVNRA